MWTLGASFPSPHCTSGELPEPSSPAPDQGRFGSKPLQLHPGPHWHPSPSPWASFPPMLSFIPLPESREHLMHLTGSPWACGKSISPRAIMVPPPPCSRYWPQLPAFWRTWWWLDVSRESAPRHSSPKTACVPSLWVTGWAAVLAPPRPLCCVAMEKLPKPMPQMLLSTPSLAPCPYSINAHLQSRAWPPVCAFTSGCRVLAGRGSGSKGVDCHVITEGFIKSHIQNVAGPGVPCLSKRVSKVFVYHRIILLLCFKSVQIVLELPTASGGCI